VHPDIAEERRVAREGGKPWTQLRPLREGVDDPSGRSCEGSQGCFGTACAAPVAGVQYAAFEDGSLFYCAEHGILQDAWDEIFYRSLPMDQPDPGPAWHEEVDRIRARWAKKDQKREQDYDP
jgi:hypothetical protein